MDEYLEDQLMEFLQANRKPFPLVALLKYLGEPITPFALEDLANYLVVNQLAYLNPAFDGKDSLWLSRAGLFTGKTLVIQPTKDEITNGILIPGSRFVPFYDPYLLPHELTFTWKGEELPVVGFRCAPSEVYPYYRLFGDEYSPQYLSLDNEENTALFRDVDFEDPSEISVTVIDMGNLYWNAGFKLGDRILARLDDWAEGVFELSILPASQVDRKKEAIWLKDMEESFFHSFEIAGPCTSIEEQVSFAFYLGHHTLFTPHAAGVEAFLDHTATISVEPYGVETRLWFTDTVVPSRQSWNMAVIRNPATLVEDAIVHMGLPVSLEILDSYILDALYRRETSADQMLHRLIPGTRPGAAFCNPVIERYVVSRFAELSAGYNFFTDQETGELRDRLIELHAAIAGFVFHLQQTGLDPDDIPEQGAVVLSQIMGHTISSLENLDYGPENEPVDFDQLWVSLEGMEDSFFDIKTVIQDALPGLHRHRFSVLKETTEGDSGDDDIGEDPSDA